MPLNIAFLDADALVVLLTSPSHLTEADLHRRSFTRQHMKKVREQRVHCRVSAPVIAELATKVDGKKIVSALGGLMAGVRIDPLTFDAALIAGQMRAKMLPVVPPNTDRVRIKYDILIAAIAHHAGARYLITGNPSDMRNALAAVASGVEILDINIQPPGQLLLLPDE